MAVVKRVTVFFCDDKPDDCGDDSAKPFWYGRREWDDTSWPEWEVKRIAQPGGHGPMYQRFINEINKHSASGAIFVVTDANFGAGPRDGAQLLKMLNDRVVRGVVFSVEPELLTEQELSEKLWRVVDHLSGEEAATIRQFLKDGARGGPDGVRDRNLLFSRAIHALENLAVPIRMDIGTLSEPSLLDEIFLENLGLGGYLAEERSFARSSGIEAEIAYYLRPLAALKVTALEPYLTEGKIDREKVRVELRIKAAREESNAMTAAGRTVDKVRSALEGVATALTDLADTLRHGRNAEEQHTQGA